MSKIALFGLVVVVAAAWTLGMVLAGSSDPPISPTLTPRPETVEPQMVEQESFKRWVRDGVWSRPYFPRHLIRPLSESEKIHAWEDLQAFRKEVGLAPLSEEERVAWMSKD